MKLLVILWAVATAASAVVLVVSAAVELVREIKGEL